MQSANVTSTLSTPPADNVVTPTTQTPSPLLLDLQDSANVEQWRDDGVDFLASAGTPDNNLEIVGMLSEDQEEAQSVVVQSNTGLRHSSNSGALCYGDRGRQRGRQQCTGF